MAEAPSTDPIPREQLEAWEVPGPPSDFVARVVARTHGRADPSLEAEESAPVERIGWLRRRGPLAAVAAAAVAALWLVVDPSLPVHGSRTLASRTTVSLGHRGVAVAEAGASLRWDVGWRGQTAVEQVQGEVFYRVDPGGPSRSPRRTVGSR